LGFSARECTPELIRVAMHLSAEIRSFERTSISLRRVLGFGLSAKTLERLVGEVGQELAQPSSLPEPKETVTAQVAVVSCDGGRLHTRETGHGPGVYGAKWRETKNASFERMQTVQTHAADPCPTLPDTFREIAHVAKIAEQAAFQAESPQARNVAYQGPKRILRTCLSSLVSSDEFGPQMKREAQRRNLFAARQRVFLGDGLPWNWSLWREHFRTFTPILDFIHAVQYLYAAAQAWELTDVARWSRYLELTEAIWQGRVDEVISQLRARLAVLGVSPDDQLADDNPHLQLFVAARYLQNNRLRMDYPRYRRDGLPITSAPMESLIKQINLRVKGTEMFWNDPQGGEAILQLRAASLCEDNRLDDYLRRRPGQTFTRRPHLATAA
jgi:hypothetical protein